MQFTITINATVERTTGRFASKSEILEAIVDEIERADPGEISGVGPDGSSEYEVTTWEVSSDGN